MPDIAETLADATLQLEAAQSSVGTDAGAAERAREALAGCLASLRSASGEAERAATGANDLIRLEARAAENLDLAALFLERDQDGGASTSAGLQSALFHARRALDYFQRFLEELTERTRTLDRERNRQEFLSG